DPAERQPREPARSGPPDVPGADEQPVRRHLRVGGIFAQGPQEQVRHPEHAATIPVPRRGRPGPVQRLRTSATSEFSKNSSCSGVHDIIAVPMLAYLVSSPMGTSVNASYSVINCSIPEIASSQSSNWPAALGSSAASSPPSSSPDTTTLLRIPS